jgi:hypothetical protein
MYIDYLIYNWCWDDGMEPSVQQMSEEEMKENLDWFNKNIVPSCDFIEEVNDYREYNAQHMKVGGGDFIVRCVNYQDVERDNPEDFFASAEEYAMAMQRTRSLSLVHWLTNHRSNPVYLYQLFCHDDYEQCMLMPVVYENTHHFLTEVNQALGTNYETINEFNLDQEGELIATYTRQPTSVDQAWEELIA